MMGTITVEVQQTTKGERFIAKTETKGGEAIASAKKPDKAIRRLSETLDATEDFSWKSWAAGEYQSGNINPNLRETDLHPAARGKKKKDKPNAAKG